MKNKRGWLKIMESFISITLIAGVVFLIISNLGLKSPDSALQIYDAQYSVLREIQLDGDLRQEILSVPNLPIEWGDFDENGLDEVENKITTKTPAYLTCEAKLCEIGEQCLSSSTLPEDKSIYVQPIIISAENGNYNPRKLNMFCWVQG